MAKLKVLRPGMLTTIQDRGRFGQGHLGVPQQGAIDQYAMRWAQRLARCDADAAVLEITLLGPMLEVLDPCFAALAGAELGAEVNGVAWPAGSSRRLFAGDVLSFPRAQSGLRAYLAFAGGIEAQSVLGSASTDLQSQVGGYFGRALRPGDVLQVGDGEGTPRRAPVETAIMADTVRVLRGPRDELFGPDALCQLTSAPYRVTPQSDRVGMRLLGPKVSGAPADIPSEGLPIGGIEILPSGQPIVLLQGRGSIGGYPVLATVISADLPVLAQLRPGRDLTFRLVELPEARAARAEIESRLRLPLGSLS